MFNRTEEKAHAFKQQIIEFGIELPIHIVTNVDEVVARVDVINCSTRSNVPLFNGDLRDGMHINGVGSYLPHIRAVDLSTIEKAKRIVVDDLESAKGEAGEMIMQHMRRIGRSMIFMVG